MSADSINYHHLLYFWTVVREGSVTAACEKLHLAQPTISGQLKKLEQQMGGKLYERIGREMSLTDLGQTVYRYADEIFSLGQELANHLKGRATGRPARLHIGVPEVLPKLIVFRLLQPLLSLPEPVQIVCHEGSEDQLLTRLASHELDVVLSDSPSASAVRVKVFHHSLGRCGVGLFGTRDLVRRYGRDVPHSLAGAPFLLPITGTALRRSFDQWLSTIEIPIRVLGEFDDTALMKVFAESGAGFVPAPLAVEADIREKFDLHRAYVLPDAIERFYAITVERKLRHSAVVAISETARLELFKNRDEA